MEIKLDRILVLLEESIAEKFPGHVQTHIGSKIDRTHIAELIMDFTSRLNREGTKFGQTKKFQSNCQGKNNEI